MHTQGIVPKHLPRLLASVVILSLVFGRSASAQLGQSGSLLRPDKEPPSPVILSEYSSESGAKRVYQVPEERLRRTPAWAPETKKSPPLSLNDAVQRAKKHVKATKPNDMLVVSIEMMSVNVGDGMRWYYTISMYDQADVWRNEPPDVVEVVLLMDGAIVEPTNASR